MDPRIILFTLYLCGGTLLALLGIPLIRRKVPPNPWYGFRVPRTLSDAAVWYPANRYAGGWMLVTGLGWVAAATVGYLLPVGFVSYALACAGVLLVILAIGMVQSFRYLRRLPGGTSR